MNPADLSTTPPVPEDWGITLLRCSVATMVGIHAVTRTLAGTVGGLGEYLTSEGLPAGLVLAWAITSFELLGGVALLLRRWVVPVCAIFILELLTGIAMVHFLEGWFVVGGGRNGMEYSVLLILGFLAVLISTWRARRGWR